MPSIDTVVADFQSGALVGVSAMPDSATTNMDKTIDATCHVKYNFVHMKGSITPGNRMKCEGAAASLSFNGSYLFFQDDWSTVANMDANRRLVVSGKFSGCMWKVFHSGDQAGTLKCVHIARPGGAQADRLVQLMTAGYAAANNWRQIQELPTAGHVGRNGCVEVFVVSQLFPNQRVDSIVLDINNQGLVVGTTFQSDRI